MPLSTAHFCSLSRFLSILALTQLCLMSVSDQSSSWTSNKWNGRLLTSSEHEEGQVQTNRSSMMAEKTIEEKRQEQQKSLLLAARSKCEEAIIHDNAEWANGEKRCPMTWDTALCWKTSPAGTLNTQRCPDYVFGFNHQAEATKYCESDGSWQVSQATNESWTNYTACSTLPEHETLGFSERHLGVIRSITTTGYSISLASLIIAFAILRLNKKLRCPRNSLHLHLFFSFMIRSSAFLVKSVFSLSFEENSDSLMETQSTTSYNTSSLLPYFSDQNAVPFLVKESNSISCKAFTVIVQYSLLANYNWILMEGIYLHNLIFLYIFNDNTSIMKYVVTGWGLPVLFIIPWTTARLLLEDTLCWTTHESMWIFWILRGPVTLSILLNTVFFVLITRVLFLKMFPSSPQFNRQYNYKQWFKSTLVLVPLFGVHYMFLLIFNSFSALDEKVEVVWLFVDLLFTSFQGFFVALLYCFLNGEVQQEVSKFWRSHVSLNRFLCLIYWSKRQPSRNQEQEDLDMV